MSSKRATQEALIEQHGIGGYPFLRLYEAFLNPFLCLPCLIDESDRIRLEAHPQPKADMLSR
jgi:hypothetical protein